MPTTAQKSPAKQGRTPSKSRGTKSPAKKGEATVVRSKTIKPVEVAATVEAKRVRGSFSIPESDYARIASLKAAAKGAGIKAKKNELLRLGLQVLESLPPVELRNRILAMRLAV